MKRGTCICVVVELTQWPQSRVGRNLLSPRCLPLPYHTPHPLWPASAAVGENQQQVTINCWHRWMLAIHTLHTIDSVNTSAVLVIYNIQCIIPLCMYIHVPGPSGVDGQSQPDTLQSVHPLPAQPHTVQSTETRVLYCQLYLLCCVCNGPLTTKKVATAKSPRLPRVWNRYSTRGC